jgi:hypothetical protein
MEDFVVGLFILIMGAAVCFFGLRVYILALPIFGFMAGFYVGAAGIEALFGDGFLSTVSGWVAGLLVGLLFALLSYLIWYVGVCIAAGSTGALLGSGLLGLFGLDDGLLVFLVSAALAALFIVGAVLLALPVWVIVISTGISGAATVVAGSLLMINTFDVEDLERGTAWAAVDASWLWLIVWGVLAGAGIAAQVRSITAIELPEDRWSRMQYAT